MEIRVAPGETIESALRRFKKATQKAGVLAEAGVASAIGRMPVVVAVGVDVIGPVRDRPRQGMCPGERRCGVCPGRVAELLVGG